MRRSFLWAVGLVGSTLLATSARPVFAGHDFTDRPQLVIDAGMHTAQINGIGVNPACTRLVTASDDKTIKVWDLTAGAKAESAAPSLLRTLRPPINPGLDGQIYAVALHPSGSLVAASGWTPSRTNGFWTIYLFDEKTGEVSAVLRDNPARVRHLVFSKDGQYLAATIGTLGQEPSGVRVWKTGTWDAPWMVDYDGYGPSHGADFDESGKLYTVAYPEKRARNLAALRRYDVKQKTRDAYIDLPFPDPLDVAAQPGGDLVAVGRLNEAAVLVYRSSSAGLHLQGQADTKGTTDAVGNVGWSSDGQFLFAAGSHADADGQHHLFRRWSDRGLGVPRDFVGPTENITQLLPCGEGLAWAARDPAFGMMSNDGTLRSARSRVGPDLRKTRFDKLLSSVDGRTVAFPVRVGGGEPVLGVFDLTGRWPRFEPRSPGTKDLYPANIDTLEFSGWHEGQLLPPAVPDYPLLEGEPIAPWLNEPASSVLCRRFPGERDPCYRFRDDEHWRSLAISADRSRFVLGSEWWVRGYARTEHGVEVLWRRPTPGPAWSLNVSSDGRTVVAAYGDGTIRWYDMDDGRERLALFVHEGDGRWIAWTPDGFFTASLGGESLVGWHFNKGAEAAADVFPVDRYREKYARDEHILSALGRPVTEPAVERGPTVTIITPTRGAKFDETGLDQQVEYSLGVPLGFEPHAVEFHFNGVLKERVLVGSRDLGKALKRRIRLLKRSGHLTVRFSASRVVDGMRRHSVESQTVDLRYVGSVPEPLPRLFGLLVGTEMNYLEGDLLQYPIDDAIALGKSLKAQVKAFRDHDIQLLVDQDGLPVTAKAIRKELRALAGRVALERGDTVTVFAYSGHGVEDSGGRFYLVPERLQPPNGITRDEYLEEHSVEQGDLVDLLSAIPGRKLLLLDACRSGNVRIASLANPILASGGLSAFLYAATEAERNSEECASEGHGCFTKAVLEALSEDGAAMRQDPADVTTTAELDAYVVDRVRELTVGRQTPVMIPTDPAMPHFEIAHAR